MRRRLDGKSWLSRAFARTLQPMAPLPIPGNGGMDAIHEQALVGQRLDVCTQWPSSAHGLDRPIGLRSSRQHDARPHQWHVARKLADYGCQSLVDIGLATLHEVVGTDQQVDATGTPHRFGDVKLVRTSPADAEVHPVAGNVGDSQTLRDAIPDENRSATGSRCISPRQNLPHRGDVRIVGGGVSPNLAGTLVRQSSNASTMCKQPM